MGAQGLGPEGESLMSNDAFTASARRISCMFAAMYIGLSTVSHVPVVPCRADQLAACFTAAKQHKNSWHCSQTRNK